MKKILLVAVACAAMTSPVVAKEKASKETNVFIEQARKIVEGERQITAVREDGAKTAVVKISRDGVVSGTVDGKPVNVVFRDY